jgi:hypothetical protein
MGDVQKSGPLDQTSIMLSQTTTMRRRGKEANFNPIRFVALALK